MASTCQTVTEVSYSRNWLELPRDITMMILMKLDTVEILETAQFVCKLWNNLCKDPSMWRIIKIQNPYEYELQDKYQKILFNAVNRSSCELISLDIEGFSSDELISCIIDRSSQLKHLRLACCRFTSAGALFEALNKHSQLEELELTLCSFSTEEIKNIIRLCSFLRTFKLNELGSRTSSFANDDEVFAIADNMQGLLHLQLIGNSMTNDGLKAILDNCPNLQSLDLRACFHIDLLGDLRKRCTQQIKNFRHPYDATDDYGFRTTDYDSGYSEISADEYNEMEFLSDDQYYNFSDDGCDDYPLSDEDFY